MRRSYLFMLAGLVCLAGAANASSSIPKAYQGKWARDSQACADPEMTAGVIISARRLTFYELVVKVDTVEVEKGSIAVSGQFDDAGSQGPGTVHLALEDHGEAVTFSGDLTQRYIRCR